MLEPLTPPVAARLLFRAARNAGTLNYDVLRSLGDLPGHEFHGNQWTTVASSAIAEKHGTTDSPWAANFILRDGTMVRGNSMHHQAQAEKAGTSLDELEKEGVIRKTTNGIETAHVPSKEQATLIADNWNTDRENTTHFMDVTVRGITLGSLTIEGRITADAIRSFAKRAIDHPRDQPALHVIRRLEFDESKHPRDEQGKWTDGGAAGSYFKPLPEDFKIEDAEYNIHTQYPTSQMVVASVDVDLLSSPYPADWRVSQMAEAMKQGAKFPPITISQYPDKLVIEDGNTRIAALRELGVKGRVPAVIKLYGDGSALPKGVRVDDKRTASLRAGGRRALARRDDMPVHRAADTQLPAMIVAVRYAFARGRQAVSSGPDVAAKAVKQALLKVLPSALLKTLIAGAEATKVSSRRRAAAFNPDEARDERGRWSDGESLTKSDGFLMGGGANLSFHGTLSEVLASIKEHGLIPSGGKGADAAAKAAGWDHVEKFKTAEREGSVFLAYDNKTAEQYSRWAVSVNPGSTSILLAVKIPSAELRSADLKFSFDNNDPKAIAWAKKHAAELATGISETTRENIAAAIADALESGGEAEKAIRAAVGDDARAEMIARTEIMSAANEGQRQAWEQAVSKGLLDESTKRVWIATGDACPICEALDGETAPLDGEYPNDGGDGPPQHPNCRCTEGIANE